MTFGHTPTPPPPPLPGEYRVVKYEDLNVEMETVCRHGVPVGVRFRRKPTPRRKVKWHPFLRTLAGVFLIGRAVISKLKKETEND